MRRRADLWRILLAPFLIAAAAWAIHHLCVIPHRDNRLMRDIEARMGMLDSVDSLRAKTLARLNLDDLDRVARSRELDPEWYLFYGANCELLDRWEDAASAYTDALAIDQRPEIYFSRGLVRLHLGQIDDAEADMIRAVRFNPFLIDRIGGELRERVGKEAGLS
jgi:tetratricopeptide (TPR) repeat protein